MDRIKRGRKAKGEEYEGLRKILGAEMMEPKGVGKKGRRSLVVAIGKAQLAAASIGEGWKKGTEIRMRRDKEVGEHRETLKTIMRAWLGYSQGRPGWKEWGRCKCETKWCTCKHVVMGQDIGMHWIWIRSWHTALAIAPMCCSISLHGWAYRPGLTATERCWHTCHSSFLNRFVLKVFTNHQLCVFLICRRPQPSAPAVGPSRRPQLSAPAVGPIKT